jgi:KamA family protein
MDGGQSFDQPRYRAYGRKQIDSIPGLEKLTPEQHDALRAVSAVLPFKVNEYVARELIDWDDIPRDPIYQLTFPQPGMLEPRDFGRMLDLVRHDVPEDELTAAAREIQMRMNPHPAGQRQLNVPTVDGEPLPGCQHKYRETVLFFPAAGQTCHAYCTYCFRWAQFVGIDELKFANRQVETLVQYLHEHTEVSDVLFTGGDPMIMSAKLLRRHIEPLLADGLEHVTSIRIGTKSPAYWPFRFTTDPDADDVLRLFEEVARAGKQLALMAHFSHPRELSTPPAREAIRRINATGAVIRCQAPLIRRVNDDPGAWADMWSEQVRLGAVPYYMFVERDTGPKHYFEVPLARAYRIFSEAYGRVSGLGRTVRGPSMSAAPGKVLVDGTTEIDGERLFVLKMIQGRDPDWVNRVFFARYDTQAAWLTDLEPAFDNRDFFFQPQLSAMYRGRWQPAWREGDDDVEEMTA